MNCALFWRRFDILERKTILLIVEDEAIIALALAQTIRSFGFDVLIANTGEKALEIAADGSTIDLVLMDIDLGEGIDGPEAAQRILARRHLPIVFCSSHSEKEYVEKVKQITRYGYVLKNSGNFVLRSTIEMAFELFEAHNRSERAMKTMELSVEGFCARIRGELDAVADSLEAQETRPGGPDPALEEAARRLRRLCARCSKPFSAGTETKQPGD